MPLSLLELILQEEPTEHPSPYPPKKVPFLEGTWWSIGRRAVEILQEPAAIQQFMSEYAMHIHEKYNLELPEAEKSAQRIVGYCTSYVDDERANQWFTALPAIRHPITGRQRPSRTGENVDLYYIVASSSDQEVQRYVHRKLTEIGFGFSMIEQDQLPTDTPYFVVPISPPKKGLLSGNEGYLFLSGFLHGFSSQMELEIGKSCQIKLEILPQNQVH